jgi:hypothetical protein
LVVSGANASAMARTGVAAALWCSLCKERVEMRELLFPVVVIALLLSPLGIAAWLRRPCV